MHALRRSDTSVKAYRSMEYRMYSSFMSTLKEMQQDTYTQQHHLQQQPSHHVQRQHHQQQQEALANLRGAWRRVSPAVEELMSSVAPEAPAAASPEASALSLPWYIKYSRWKPTSRQEAVHAEKSLLQLCSTPLDVRDVSVGQDQQQFMHTISAEDQALFSPIMCILKGDFGVCSTPLDVRDVSVGQDQQQFMHTISAGDQASPPMVMLPGYGAGSGFYFRNIGGLAQHFRLHCVDLLGTGMSGRPRFPAKSREDAEDFFLSSLQRWREAMHMDKMVLVGHSLGGYLAASYALKYPQHVQHLVLVCPAGVPEEAGPRRLPSWAESPWSVRGQMFRLSRTLWEAGATPGAVIRTLGPWGPGLIQKYARSRFREGMGLTSQEVAAFEEYFYHIMAARGSGEHALRHLLAPFARAKHPLEGRLHELKVPVSFVYGETDWMDPKAGVRVAASVRQSRGALSSTDCQVDIIPQAGHYPFLDQPMMFLEKVLSQTLKAFPKWKPPQQEQQPPEHKQL
ncbi:g12639 [Coccomyxa viridis]|uniref:G12639 protein n=1 Tax=Coccomyxa viridis TaxID=1274662 RepID=A0ABP1GHW4_9CHLO